MAFGESDTTILMLIIVILYTNSNIAMGIDKVECNDIITFFFIKKPIFLEVLFKDNKSVYNIYTETLMMLNLIMKSDLVIYKND